MGSIPTHAGVDRIGEHDSVTTPLYSNTTVPTPTCDQLAARFADTFSSGRKGEIYERLGSKSGFELECALTGLHACGDAMVFGSGMAAISHAVITLVQPGENVVVHRSLYGCTDDYFRVDLPRLGIESRFVDLRNPIVLRQAVDERTRAVFFETPSNPTLDLINIAAVAGEVNGRCPVIVDNTFASPLGQNPFDQGAHLVVYSLTKSIG
ncbi:MAG: PLP-dependent transferase, partial [Candidatus Micrarchaeota archaeon]|nr:PLP-dependent transferase [Candidatus Micrarchaeota archaeon]